MGSKTTQWLFEHALKKPFSGAVLELGVQGISFDYNRLAAVAKAACYDSQVLTDLLAEGSLESPVTHDDLFKSLGFSEVVTTDYDSFEGADFTFDLNAGGGVPIKWKEHFDCVMDGGTMEHVFHTYNVLKNIFEFLKVGGRVVHMSPSNNWIDHGFYSFSPTFFCDYYAANGFEIDKCSFVEITRDVEGTPWVFGDYSPGDLDAIQFGGLNDNVYLTFFIATKTSSSTFGRIPQQSQYTNTWAGTLRSGHAATAERFRQMDAATDRPSWLQASFDKLVPHADRLANWLRRPSARRDFPLPRAKLY